MGHAFSHHHTLLLVTGYTPQHTCCCVLVGAANFSRAQDANSLAFAQAPAELECEFVTVCVPKNKNTSAGPEPAVYGSAGVLYQDS